MSTRTITGPTPGQLEFGHNLIDEIAALGYRGDYGSPEAWAERSREYFDRMDVRAAGDGLDRLKALKTSLLAARPTPAPRRRDPEVAEGRYALETDDGVKFYRVRIPKNGRFKGRSMLDAQAGDDFHPVRSRDTRLEVLGDIAIDPAAAMIRYGKTLGTCGNCGRTLTDPESIEAGIGPVCASRLSL